MILFVTADGRMTKAPPLGPNPAKKKRTRGTVPLMNFFIKPSEPERNVFSNEDVLRVLRDSESLLHLNPYYRSHGLRS